jgi:hypothetical protein
MLNLNNKKQENSFNQNWAMENWIFYGYQETDCEVLCWAYANNFRIFNTFAWIWSKTIYPHYLTAINHLHKLFFASWLLTFSRKPLFFVIFKWNFPPFLSCQLKFYFVILKADLHKVINWTIWIDSKRWQESAICI